MVGGLVIRKGRRAAGAEYSNAPANRLSGGPSSARERIRLAMPITEYKGEPVREFADPPAWEAWLLAHHDQPGGVWLRHAKKASGHRSVTHAEALEIAICFGWIDAQRAPLDESFYLHRFIRRRARSRWSQVNRTT